MQLYSTKNKAKLFELKEAVLKGLPDDNGLFMPVSIPKLPEKFFQSLEEMSFSEIGFEVSKALFDGYIPEADLIKIVQEAINFPAPLVPLNDSISILELFHGPSLAFKDFGARYMAQLMSYFNRGEEKELVILVATSGDTGGAVATGFYKTPGIKVVILYPSGKVSPLQEKQLTTLGHNITALEVDGTFDDCQALVKKAFLDKKATDKIRLTSANSINISRLIPQSFYYFEAFKQASKNDKELVFCVPSGNFGNLTAGIFAQRMGLPIRHFIAATNLNDIVPSYLKSGIYSPKPSVRTISNAMDVGNPSNFARMEDLYSSTWNIMHDAIDGYAFDDDATRKAILEVNQKYGYVIDPHGAVGYLAAKAYLEKELSHQVVVLETAHPSKFKEEVESVLGKQIEVPYRLAKLENEEKDAIAMSTTYADFQTWLLDNY